MLILRDLSFGILRNRSMCGIFGYVGNNVNSPKLVFDGLKSLEYRGYDSWGIAAIPVSEDPKIRVIKKAGKIGNADIGEILKGKIALGHTRWATHGKVSDVNSHPHLDCSGSIAIVHNGIFENYSVKKRTLIAKKHRFLSGTDSEVIAHEIEEYKKVGMKFEDAVRKTFLNISGLNAVIAISSGDNQMVAVRNGSPLVIGFGKAEYFLASDVSALYKHTKNVYFLRDDEMAVISLKGIEFKNIRTNKSFIPKPIHPDWEPERSAKGKYPHYMLKEIYEQKDIVLNIFEDKKNYSKNILDSIKHAGNLYLVGCGSAYYACLAGSYLFSTIAGKQAVSVIGSEFGYQLDFLNSGDLVIAISQSGETMDIIESVKKAKQKGATILAIVNVLGSTLYRESDYRILIQAGPEKSVASTKALTGMIAHLLKLAYRLSDSKNFIDLKRLSSSITNVLSSENVKRIMDLADSLEGNKNVYVIGRGVSYAVSLEAAMKIKEISYIHAEGLAAGELKHGPLALVEKGTPCIAFLPDDETYGANLAGSMEMRARGGMLIGVSYRDNEIFDKYLPVKKCGKATIIPNIITAQLLAYYMTIGLGHDPDMPRNLAKSVTVK